MIYDCPVWQLIADAANDVSQPYTADAIDGWFRENFPKIKPGTVAAHIRGLTANDPSRHHYPPLAAKPPLFFRTASGDLDCFDADSHTSETAIAAAARPARRRRQAGLHGPRTYIDVRVTTSIQALPDTRRFDHTKLLKLMAELDDNFARSNAYAARAPPGDPRPHPANARLHQLHRGGKQLPLDAHGQGLHAQTARLQDPG